MNAVRDETSEPPIDDSMDLNPIWIKYRSNWRWVVGCVVAGIVIGNALMLLARPVWIVNTTLLFPIHPVSLIAGTAGLSIPTQLSIGGPSPIKIAKEVFESEPVLDRVMQQTGMTRKKLKGRLTLSVDQTTNIMTIQSKETSSDVGQTVHRAYVQAFREFGLELGAEGALQDIDKMRLAVQQYQKRLTDIQDSIQRFEKESASPAWSFRADSNVPSPDISSPVGGAGQVSRPAGTPIFATSGIYQEISELGLEKIRLQAVIAAIHSRIARETVGSTPPIVEKIPLASKWRELLAEAQFQLENAQIVSGPQAPEVAALKERIDYLKGRLKSAIDAYLAATHNNVGDAQLSEAYVAIEAIDAKTAALQRLAQAAPAEEHRFQQLLREQSVVSEIYARLRIELALAELSSEADLNHWEVLDDAVVSDKPANKGFARPTIIWGALGLALGSVLALTRRRKGSTLPERR